MRRTFAYRNVLAFHGEEALPYLNTLRQAGASAIPTVIAQLQEWDVEGNGDVRGHAPWGEADQAIFQGDYYLFWNFQLDYIGLSAPATEQQCFEWGDLERVNREREEVEC